MTTVANFSSMSGSSRLSLAKSRTALDKKLNGLLANDCATLARELHAVVTTLDSSTSLRRAITDPARGAAEKTVLINKIFSKTVSKSVLELLSEIAALRWSAPSHVANTCEQLAIEAEAAGANAEQELDRLEEELFSFSRVVASNPELRQVLSAPKFSAEGKRDLVAKLLNNKVSSASSHLIAQIVSALRGRNIEGTIAFYAAATAARRDRVIAHVRSAVELTSAQQDKLSSALSKKIGQPVRINVEVDSRVLGGISIRFADELIDGTIVNRLADAGRSLVG